MATMFSDQKAKIILELKPTIYSDSHVNTLLVPNITLLLNRAQLKVNYVLLQMVMEIIDIH